MNSTIDLMKNHRSIRKYQDRAIEPNILKEILIAGQCASTSSYVQAYSIISVNDKDKREQLFEWTGNQKNVLNCPEFLIFCADLTKIKGACINDFQGEYMEWLLIATVDVALMAQNVYLAAESLGIGGVYVGAVRNEPQKISDMLDLPDYVYPVFGMCLGYPDQSPILRPRMPLDLVFHEEKYQSVDNKLMKAYNEDVKAYYIERTRGKLDHTWYEQMASKAEAELRPHMKSYLESKGFSKK